MHRIAQFLSSRVARLPLRSTYPPYYRVFSTVPLPSNPKLVIVFGSQTGTAEAFANDLEFDAEDYDIETEIIDANDFSVSDLMTRSSSPNTTVALIMASYGEGEPTDNAKAFMSAIEDSEAKSDFGLCHYSVFGLGNSQCFPDRYNVVAKTLDQQLKMLGAKQVVGLGLGDASGDMAGTFEEWKEQVIRSATASTAADAEDTPSDQPSDLSPDTRHVIAETGESVTANVTLPPRQNVPILSPRQLALIPSGRVAFLPKVASKSQHFLATDEFTSAVSVSFDISRCDAYVAPSTTEAPISFTGAELTANLEAGDHIGVFAPNSTLVIKRFAANAYLSDNELNEPYDSLADPTVSLCDVLKWQVQLSGTVPITTLKILLRWARDESVSAHQTSSYLSGLIGDYDSRVRNRGLGIASVLASVCAPHPAQDTPPLPLKAILKSLPVISPRLYSLTNDPEENTDTATLLCRLLRYRDCASGSLVSGLCSSYLCERLEPSTQALIFFRQSNFHLPTQPTTPVIMICGGSGIAPFLSFLERRAYYLQKNPGTRLGPAMLYSGCRNTNEYMYRDELHHHLAVGSLSRLVVTFSDTSADASNPDQHQEEIKALFKESTQAGEEIFEGRCNVTDRVDAEAEFHLKGLMRQGAYVYVCGGAGNFGRAVRNSVEHLVQVSLPEELTGRTRESSSSSGRDEGVRLLVKEKRYFEDLAD